jgi:hypothetical protein
MKRILVVQRQRHIVFESMHNRIHDNKPNKDSPLSYSCYRASPSALYAYNDTPAQCTELPSDPNPLATMASVEK